MKKRKPILKIEDRREMYERIEEESVGWLQMTDEELEEAVVGATGYRPNTTTRERLLRLLFLSRLKWMIGE